MKKLISVFLALVAASVMTFCLPAGAFAEETAVKHDFTFADFAVWTRAGIDETRAAFGEPAALSDDLYYYPGISFCGYDGYLQFYRGGENSWEKVVWNMDGGPEELFSALCGLAEEAGGRFMDIEAGELYGVEFLYELNGQVVRIGHTDEYGPLDYISVSPEDRIEQEGARQPDSRADASFDIGEWVGYYSTKDDTLSEMVITPGENGRLRAETYFLRTMKTDAQLTPQADGSMLYESQGGALIGTLTRDEDGILTLVLTGGYSYNDEEATEYNDYFARTFRYEITVYDQMWYEEPTGIPVSDEDWTGTWAAEKGGHRSTLYLVRDNGQLFMRVRFDNEYAFSGPLSESGENVMDFSGEEFFCMLTLSRKQGAIIMEEIGASDDGIYDWLDPFPYNIVEYYRTE